MKQPTFEMTIDLICALSNAIGALEAINPAFNTTRLHASLNGALEYLTEEE